MRTLPLSTEIACALEAALLPPVRITSVSIVVVWHPRGFLADSPQCVWLFRAK